MGERGRLLAVCTAAPWPVRDGYTLRVSGLLGGLAREWAITLVLPLSGEMGREMPGAIARHVPVPLGGPGLFYPWRFDQAGLRAAVAGAVAADCYDCALLWPGAENLAGVAGVPAVADVIDCNALEFWRALRRARGRARVWAGRELVTAAWYGARSLRACAATLCVGEDDAAWLRRLGLGRAGVGRAGVGRAGVGRASLAGGVAVVANGVDLPARVTAEAEVPTVVFSGTLDFGPNVAAVLFAARQLWPLVRAAVPAAEFVVAGRRPVAAIRALDGRDGVRVLGEVADMAAVLGRGWVSVAPMLGVGIKNKVLEAWASGRPVVMSPLATNGLVLPEGHGALVHDGAAAMAAAVVGLLRDAAGRGALGAAARAHVAAHCRWEDAAAAVHARLLAAAGLAA